MVLLSVIFSLSVLVGCTDAVIMRHAVTGKTAQCGPYSTARLSDSLTVAERERGCILDYQRQGYERVMR